MAMSAMVVGEWALTTNPAKKRIGDVLQLRDSGDCDHLTTAPTGQRGKWRKSLRATGKPWVESFFRERTEPVADSESQLSELRKGLRYNAGMVTQWTSKGLVLRCYGDAKERLISKKRRRRQEAGECSMAAIRLVQLQSMWVGNSQGHRGKWTDYKDIFPRTQGFTLGDLIDITHEDDGALLMCPKTHVMPLESRMAHQFRDICLCILTNYPELAGAQRDEALLTVVHKLEDQHHVFEAGAGSKPTIEHTWGFSGQQIDWAEDKQTAAEAVAAFLKVDARTVSVAPHPRWSKMMPLWVGKRRWTQSRRSYKQLINRAVAKEARAVHKRIRGTMYDQNAAVASALDKLAWRKIHRMEGASAYHRQNMYRLKMNRLRAWAGEEEGMHCQAPSCAHSSEGGTIHLAWECPDAQRYWTVWLDAWRWGDSTSRQDKGAPIQDIFGLRLSKMPEWLVRWGVDMGLQDWVKLHQTADEMWALGVAVTVTAIWRWNVDRIHPGGGTPRQLAEAIGLWRIAMKEAYERYRLTLFPITADSIDRIKVAAAITGNWTNTARLQVETIPDEFVRVAFFDGGSRGNPGPGGSGSVVIKIGGGGKATIEWAAATALGGATMTNNVAEFIGLHRLLTHAASKGWRKIHVVGDSMMVIRMMISKTPPKSKKLKHWYQAVSKLADMCAVGSWSHHYRAHNKMADWLANEAMDRRTSVMVTFTDDGATHRLQEGIVERMEGDVSKWLADRKQE